MKGDPRRGHVTVFKVVVAALGLVLWACGGDHDGGGGSPPQESLTANFVPARTEPGTNTISLRQNTEASTADTMALDLTANAVTVGKVFGLVFDLGFDSSLVEFVGHRPGQFLEATATQQVTYFIDPLQGDSRVLVVGISQLAPDAGADGDGVVVTLYFKARDRGDAVLLFRDQALLDPNATPMSLPSGAWYAGTIEVR